MRIIYALINFLLNLAISQSVPSQPPPAFAPKDLGPGWWCVLCSVTLISLPGPSGRDPRTRRCWQRWPAAVEWDLQRFLPGRGWVQQRVGCCVWRRPAEGASAHCGPRRTRPQAPGRLRIPSFTAFRPKHERLTGLTTRYVPWGLKQVCCYCCLLFLIQKALPTFFVFFYVFWFLFYIQWLFSWSLRVLFQL